MERKIDEILLSALEPLQGMAMRLMRSREEAEDLVQETCIRALRNAATLEAHPSPRAYLFRVLRNLSLDRHRQTNAHPEMVSMEELRPQDGEVLRRKSAIDAIPSIVRDSLDEDVKAALDALPKPFRCVFWLREVEGLSYEELALRFGIPTGTVRSRLSRARERMAAALHHRTPKPDAQRGRSC